MEIVVIIGNVLMGLSVMGIVGRLLAPALGAADFQRASRFMVMPLAVLFFVGLALRAVAARFVNYRVRRHSKILKKTDALARQGKYAEAAEVYTRQALMELKNSTLSFAIYCKYAVEMWIKAGEPAKALNEARNVLWVYVDNDGMWLKHDSGDYVENVTAIVSDFFGAGYTSEGAVFAGEVNLLLERFGLPIRCAAVPVRKNVFPTSCLNCGGNLSHDPYQDTAQCIYCKSIIYPLNQPPEAKQVNANAV